MSLVIAKESAPSIITSTSYREGNFKKMDSMSFSLRKFSLYAFAKAFYVRVGTTAVHTGLNKSRSLKRTIDIGDWLFYEYNFCFI